MDTAEQQAIESVGQTIWNTLPSTVQDVMIQKEQELNDKEKELYGKEDIIYEQRLKIEQQEELLLENRERILEYERLAEERRNRSVSYTRDQLRKMGVIERIGYNY